ncbi:MAG TPA: hypothetical protein VFP65_09380 [Anaeromyxobacteraceae bacterium]|nr:hypothetical protein [Anaeromyxobacteraceae bacterium]
MISRALALRGLLAGAALLAAARTPRALAQVADAFTLSVDAVDANGLPLDPMWGWQRTHAGDPPDPEVLCFASCSDFSCCSRDRVTFDVAVLPNDAICSLGAEHAIHGHANWRATTYTGRLDFQELSSDFDYNFTLVPPERRGLVKVDGVPLEAIGVEFDARETAFRFTTPWWLEFNAAVLARNGAAAAMLASVAGENGAVAGLLGLDCEHACATELHPAWGFLLHARDLPDDDTWALFGRATGNEGFCSHLQHAIGLGRLVLRIPWRAGATSVAVRDGPLGTQFRGDLPAPGSVVRITPVPGDAVYVTLPLASALPGFPPRVHGEVHLAWTPPIPSPPASSPPPDAPPAAEPPGPPEAEELLGEIYAGLPAAVRNSVQQAVGAIPAPDVIPIPFAVDGGPAPAPRRRPPRERSAPAREKLAQDVVQALALCDALGGALPGVATPCAALVPAQPDRDRDEDDRREDRDGR